VIFTTRKYFMKTNLGGRLWLGLLLAALLFPVGCASTGGGSQEYTYEESSFTAVPPSYYGGSPMLEQWYTPPDWQPDADQG
jgi:hypothetical protein